MSINPFSPGYQTQSKITAIEEPKLIQETQENTPQEISLQDQFDKLLERYWTNLQVTMGKGEFAGYTLIRQADAEYAELSKFADQHPEFKAKLPKRYPTLSHL